MMSSMTSLARTAKRRSASRHGSAIGTGPRTRAPEEQDKARVAKANQATASDV